MAPARTHASTYCITQACCGVDGTCPGYGESRRIGALVLMGQRGSRIVASAGGPIRNNVLLMKVPSVRNRDAVNRREPWFGQKGGDEKTVLW